MREMNCAVYLGCRTDGDGQWRWDDETPFDYR